MIKHSGYLADSNFKAIVIYEDDGTSYLLSYGTPVLRVNADGTAFRLWDSWSAITGRHIKMFNGMNKAQYMSLPLDNIF